MSQNLRQATGLKIQLGNTTVLLIYDTNGNLVAESAGASQYTVRQSDESTASTSVIPSPQHYADAFGSGSALTTWLGEQIELARTDEFHRAWSCLQHLDGRVNVRFEALRFLDDRSHYAVFITPFDDSIPDGSSLVTQQQWHDIKNHLGGLKLYATFLRKKITDGEYQAIVEKLLSSINGLIDHLAQIRGRGEPK